MTQSVGLLWRDLAVQCRVIGAIMLRDMVTRWGRRNLGFAWLFCEPLIFAFPVIIVWSYVRAPFEHGLPMTTFVWTGYMPLLIFRHVSSGALFSLRGSTALFYHRRVTPLDVFFGRQGLEALGNLASVAVSLVLFVCIGVMNFPEDYGLMLLGFLYTTWWSLCIALILATLSERSEIVAHVWAPISYLYIFFSGFFFLVQWLPPRLQRIVLAIDPPVHCYEMIRSGMFGSQLVHPYYDIGYVSFILAIMTLIGLWLMHDVRNHLEFQ